MDPKTTLLFIFSAIQLILCAGLFGIARGNRRAKWLAICIVPSFLWSLCLGFFLCCTDPGWSKLFATTYYIAAATLPPCYTYLSFIFTDRRASRPISIGIFFVTLIICLMVVIPGHFITGVNVATHTVYTALIPHLIYTACFMCFYIVSLAIIFFAYFRKRKKSLSLGLFIAGWLIMGIVGTIPNLFLPLLGNYQLIWVGPLGLIMLIPMAFRIATTNEHFSAVKTFARGLLYCIFGFFCLAFAFLALYFFNEIARPATAIETYSLGILVLVLFAITLLLLYQLMRSLIKQIDTDGFDEVELIAAISRITAVQHDPRDLFRAICHTLDHAFGVRQVDIIVFGENTFVHIDSIVEDAAARLVLSSRRHTIYRGDIRHQKDRDLLIAHDIEAIVPIIGAIESHPIGAILLSPRKRRFDRYYGKILERVSAILTPFIHSSVYHTEILKMNSLMKDEIAKKTQKLRASNKELMKLDVMKSDLLTIASHNLRTPITGISGYAEMLLSGSAGRLTSTQRSYIEAITRSSNTMGQIVSSLLDVSHIDSGDFTLRLEPFDLSALVREEIAPLKEIACKKGRTLTLHCQDGIRLTGDISRIKQVIINLVDNAIFYGKTTISVTLKTTDTHIIFQVTDDGIGVPKDEQQKIFEKMYRASNAEIQRPDGTGVGLYVAKNIITASGGEFIFDSTLGKGSTFGFKISNKETT